MRRKSEQYIEVPCAGCGAPLVRYKPYVARASFSCCSNQCRANVVAARRAAGILPRQNGRGQGKAIPGKDGDLIRICCRITGKEYEVLRALGKGNTSEGVRRVICRAFREIAQEREAQNGTGRGV